MPFNMPDAAPQPPAPPTRSTVPFRPHPRAVMPAEEAASSPAAASPRSMPRQEPAARARKPLYIAAGTCALLAIGAIVWYACAWPSSQQQYETAIQLYADGEKARAFPLLQQAAKKGVTEAYVPLADCYEQGVGVAADMEQARRWYESAIQVGVRGANASMAELCFKEGDYAGAYTHYETARDSLTAEQLSHAAAASCRLAESADTRSAPAYYQQAVWYLTLAAQKGSTAAAVELGNMYYHGVGVEAASRPVAADYYAMAAEQGDAAACCLAAWCLLETATPEADARAVQYLQQAAEQGNAEACYNLALCILSARGLPRDEHSAVSWLQQAADRQHPAALRKLAFIYRDATPAQLPAAIGYFEKAARLGDAEAQYNLAWCLWHGLGVQPEPEKAAYWGKLAAAQQFPPAVEFMANLSRAEEAASPEQNTSIEPEAPAAPAPAAAQPAVAPQTVPATLPVATPQPQQASSPTAEPPPAEPL
ncbi:MAG: sel1 repeat family protein [Akkermansiaceae bacterium]|nr:sel1 repeat family protein [Akkermansiaceae bacterium]